jgi:hypothetical protein
MKKLLSKIIVFCLVILFAKFETIAQITISNSYLLPQVKKGTTYIAMKDPNSPLAAAYVDAAIKNWTFSKVKCIQYKEVEQHISPNASFITIGGTMTSSDNPNANFETRVFLELWTTNGKFTYDPKKRRHFNHEDKIVLATYELFPDHLTQVNPSLLYKIDYDASGHLKNWSDGIYGNILQMICSSLALEKERTYKEEFQNIGLLKNLSNTTLYIPEYALIKYSKNSGDESKKQDEKELLADYPFPYKILSTQELNDKINNTESPIFYLLLIRSGNDRIVTISNSKNGEIIYSSFSGSSPCLKSSDLKSIAKTITKE